MISVIDLSHTIQLGMPVYPGTPTPRVVSVCTHNLHGFAEQELSITTHIGTHIDAPFHMLKEGKTLIDFSPDKFLGTAFKICYNKEGEDLIERIESKMANYGTPEFILLSSGWSENWGNKKYFMNFPLPNNDTINHIAGLKIKGLGIDTPSIDKVGADVFRNHKCILGKEIIIIENLTNLQKLPDGLFRFQCLPLKIKNSDGSPVRAIAQIDS